jgi:hypothetical protein
MVLQPISMGLLLRGFGLTERFAFLSTTSMVNATAPMALQSFILMSEET